MPIKLRTLAVLRTHFFKPTELLDPGSSTDIFPAGEKVITVKLRTLAVLPTLFGCLGNVSVELLDLSSSVGTCIWILWNVHRTADLGSSTDTFFILEFRHYIFINCPRKFINMDIFLKDLMYCILFHILHIIVYILYYILWYILYYCPAQWLLQLNWNELTLFSQCAYKLLH